MHEECLLLETGDDFCCVSESSPVPNGSLLTDEVQVTHSQRNFSKTDPLSNVRVFNLIQGFFLVKETTRQFESSLVEIYASFSYLN